jgi:hypothetical protein
MRQGTGSQTATDELPRPGESIRKNGALRSRAKIKDRRQGNQQAGRLNAKLPTAGPYIGGSTTANFGPISGYY